MSMLFFDETKPLLTKEEINLLPAINYEGEIVLVRSDEELQLAVNELKKNSLLGFDTETRPKFTKGAMNLPSLIQLATNKKVYQMSILSKLELPYTMIIALWHGFFLSARADLLTLPNLPTKKA